MEKTWIIPCQLNKYPVPLKCQQRQTIKITYHVKKKQIKRNYKRV